MHTVVAVLAMGRVVVVFVLNVADDRPNRWERVAVIRIMSKIRVWEGGDVMWCAELGQPVETLWRAQGRMLQRREIGALRSSSGTILRKLVVQFDATRHRARERSHP